MFGGDPTHSGAGTGNPILSAKVLWNFSTPGEPIGCSAAVANGMVYIGLSPDYSCIYAFNETNGQVIWRYKTADVITTPAVADGVVYVGPSDGKLCALNATNGKTVWSFQTQPVWNNYTYAIGGFHQLWTAASFILAQVTAACIL
jgi:outer membrane protein assembly factor BamB